MRDLQRDAEDVFLSALLESSDENIEQFVNDVVQRSLARNADGHYIDTIARIKITHTTWRQGRSQTGTGDQQVATDSVNETIKKITQSSQALFVKVQDKFGIASPKLIEFFPKGLTEISRANHGDYVEILTRLSGKTEKYKADLGDAIADTMAALLISWEGNKGLQSGEKSSVEEGRATRDNTIPELAQALTAHYLTVRLKNLGNAKAAVAIYFDESPLKRKSSGNADNDGLGRLILLLTLPDGSPAAFADVQYTNSRTGASFTGKTDAEGRFRSTNQGIGPVAGKVTTDSGLRVEFAVTILDNADPVHLLTLE